MTPVAKPTTARGFDYLQLPFRFQAEWQDGEWSEGGLIDDPKIAIDEGATSLHYAQQCFEGLKACAGPDGHALIFRPHDNAHRMEASAKRLVMPPPPEALFLTAVRETVRANRDYLPEHGSGGALYIRPLLIGIGPNLGVRAASRYLFRVFCSPVGKYFERDGGGLRLRVPEADRAAPRGTGAFKVGANYAGGVLHTRLAKEAGYDEVLFLDAMEHRYVEETASANVFGVGPDGRTVIAPASEAILPSVTLKSVLQVAREDLDLPVERRRVPIDEVATFSEMACVGTAVIVAPIAVVHHAGRDIRIRTAPGPIAKALYERLTGIQSGRIPDTRGWIMEA